VNLLLLDRAEIAGDGTAVVDGRRAAHLRGVLGVRAGATVRAGVVGGELLRGEVVADDGARITLRVERSGEPPAHSGVTLVLAVPRPKVLSRALEIAASFAVQRIDLTNAWRVDKSYLGSPRLQPDALAHAARLGAEQGATTHVPSIAVHARFMQLMDTFAAPAPRRFVAHPGAPPIETIACGGGTAPCTLAIGPEGGWIERELATLVERGFAPVSLGAPILRVEAAIASGLGQLALIARLD
jgi:RsmE family RNA methyltransferase